MGRKEKIAELLFDRGDEKTLVSIVPKLYDYNGYMVSKKEKGVWHFFKRNNFALPSFLDKEQESSDGFCATYIGKHPFSYFRKRYTLFNGELKDMTIVRGACKVSENILEKGFMSTHFIDFFSNAWRLRKLSDEALSYKYGLEASEVIEEEYSTIVHELRKSKLYEALTKEGCEISKESFAGVYELMDKNLDVFSQLEEMKGKREDLKKVSIESLLKVFSLKKDLSSLTLQ